MRTQQIETIPPPPSRNAPDETTRRLDHPRLSCPDPPPRTGKESAKSAVSAPIRVKKSRLLAKIENLPETELPPATSLSFRIHLGVNVPKLSKVQTEISSSKAAEGKDTTNRHSNGSLTPINENDSFARDGSALWKRISRQCLQSTDNMSPVASLSGLRGNNPATTECMAPELKARESQYGLLDSIIQITNDVLFRFGEEEDAVKAIVGQFRRGAHEVVETLTASWNDRLGHEHQNLANGLVDEKEFLAKASHLVGEQDSGSGKEVICSDDMARKVMKKRDELIAQIEALRNRNWREDRV
ncbi:uncharacterized protein Z518_10512 [Rhinocladiella mackenziei CBS 650.93]|uniref:Uncharacterized protein n=1 Tax=Rhinocladiella mackenziei CBS 650.93 TaxID=1442369 RepID=A0A0D2GPU5_9EURO|nr:uncharacterized protein Z518_10512 [Rhinocladiella mackenziei CBS 650.93]KIX00373.1 hypothetical protein Z518_10512 [Rhinocladiella mackenziei CBS 650.93]